MLNAKASISIVITGANKLPWALNGHSARSSTDPLPQHLNSARRRQQESTMGVCVCVCDFLLVQTHFMHVQGRNNTPASNYLALINLIVNCHPRAHRKAHKKVHNLNNDHTLKNGSHYCSFVRSYKYILVQCSYILPFGFFSIPSMSPGCDI